MDENNPVNQGGIEEQKPQPTFPPSSPTEPASLPPVPPQVVPPSPPAEPVPQGTGKSKMVLWAGLGFLALALVGAGAYYLGSRKAAPTVTPEPVPTQTPTPTPDPTADWKTYIDKENGWSIKYPQEWKLQEDTFSRTEWYAAKKLVVLSENKEPIEEAIRIYTHIDNGYTLQDWLNNVDRDDPEIPTEHKDGYYLGVKIPSQANYVLGGNPAIIIKYDLEKIKGECIYSAKNGLIFDICPLGKEGQMVLSTFNFIEATPSATITP